MEICGDGWKWLEYVVLRLVYEMMLSGMETGVVLNGTDSIKL